MTFKIAVEEAFVTHRIMGAWESALQAPGVEAGFQKMGASILSKNPRTKLLHDRLLDLGDARIAQMDEDGVDVQILSLTAPGVQVLDAEMAIALAIESNDILAEAIRRRPNRLAGLAAVAPNHVSASVRELQRCRDELKLCGVIVNSHTRGRYLDEPEFFPLLEAAAALRMPIYLHPREPGPSLIEPFLDYGLYFAGWGFAVECGLHAMRLIMSGVFDRLPNLKIVLGHMGEGIPFWLDRIDNRYALQVRIGAVTKLNRRPSDYFRDNFVITTSGMHSEAPLRLALSVLGPERIMFAADYPYESAREAVVFMTQASLDEEVRSAILYKNAEKVFGLKVA